MPGAWRKLVLLFVAIAFGVIGIVNASPPPPPKAQFAIVMGIGDKKFTRWDGSIRATGARILNIDGRRFNKVDGIVGNSWKMATRRPGSNWPWLENGIYVTAELLDASARFEVTTKWGKFSFAASEVRWGEALRPLGGRVAVERIPVTEQLTNTVEEQDYPALAITTDRAYLSYVEFTHGDRSQRLPRQLLQKPASYESLSRQPGGDQVMLMEYFRSIETWGAPEAVSLPGQDIYKTAVAVDGPGRLWVFWSAKVDGNFDIYARWRWNGAWSDVLRLTEDPGPDLSPVAATDSTGAVWVAWQGWRDNFQVLVARQQEHDFSAAEPVSVSQQSDWAPQIAAGPAGEVAIAWDTYDKGDYDVYLRRMRFAGSIHMEEPLPVAASQWFEVRPTLAYDAEGRIWVAYEESYRRWGKDFGAYETTGVGIYQGNTVRIKALEGDRYYGPAAPLEKVLRALPASHPLHEGRTPGAWIYQPDPLLATNRAPGKTPYYNNRAHKSYPRLATTPDGKVFLAYRNAMGNIRGTAGTCWWENVVWFDGVRWHGPVFVARSDGVLDNRPAMAALGNSSLLMIAPTDHRFHRGGLVYGGAQSEWINYDLMAHEIVATDPPETREPLAATSGTRLSLPHLRLLEAQQPDAPEPDVASEQQQVAMMRDYRAVLGDAGAREYRLLRGEFHRHTSVSGDGGNDGDIIDAWRYFIDAAYMDWAGCCDHDNGAGREYTWWWAQKMTDAFHVAGLFIPMFSYERSVRYPEGHRNVIFAQRGVRPLPRLPKTADDSPPDPAPDTQMLYEYLRYYDGIAASHTSGTNMGTDWRDNDPEVEPIVEIYQGDRQSYEMPGAPRTNTERDSIGGWRPLGFVSEALAKGYRLGFQASSDHLSTHMSYCNLWVTEPTREAMLEAFKARRVYGATDNILADVRCAGHFMGEEFTLDTAPKLEVKLAGTAPFARVHIIKDGSYVYTTRPGTAEVAFSWQDTEAEEGKTSYYYVRGEQSDGEIVWVSPMWINTQ